MGGVTRGGLWWVEQTIAVPPVFSHVLDTPSGVGEGIVGVPGGGRPWGCLCGRVGGAPECTALAPAPGDPNPRQH